MRKKKKKNIYDKHVRLHEWMLKHHSYRSLSCCSRCLLVELMRCYNGENNGHVGLSIRQAATRLNCNKDTASKAFKELQRLGFIKIKAKGSFRFKERHSTTWILTEYSYAGALPTKEFMSPLMPQNLKPSPNRSDPQSQ